MRIKGNSFCVLAFLMTLSMSANAKEQTDISDPCTKSLVEFFKKDKNLDEQLKAATSQQKKLEVINAKLQHGNLVDIFKSLPACQAKIQSEKSNSLLKNKGELSVDPWTPRNPACIVDHTDCFKLGYDIQCLQGNTNLGNCAYSGISLLFSWPIYAAMRSTYLMCECPT